MIREELLTILLSYVSLFTTEIAQLLRLKSEESSSAVDSDSEETTSIVILQPLQQIEDATTSPILNDYGTIERVQPRFGRSLKRSLWTSFTINLAVIPIGLLVIFSVCVQMYTTQLCFEHHRLNIHFSNEVKKWRIAGAEIATMTLYFMFPLTLIFLFGWERFKSSHSSTLLIAFLLGSTYLIMKVIVFKLGEDDRKQRYLYPGNFLFLLEVVWISYLVAKKISRAGGTGRPRKFKVFKIISTHISS